MKNKKDYFGIFNSWDRFDEDLLREMRENIAECNDIEPDEISDERLDEDFWEYLEDEKLNLNKETGGCIIAFADLGFWNGRRIGYKKIGTNVADILNTCFDGDYEVEWYADRYNVRLNAAHHDGTHHIVFRYVESADKADEICERIFDGRISTEDEFFRATKSIRPFVAHTYGWKMYGRQK